MQQLRQPRKTEQLGDREIDLNCPGRTIFAFNPPLLPWRLVMQDYRNGSYVMEIGDMT